MSACLEMKDVGQRFGPAWVFSHLSFKIEQGESVALFGNNGTGKSTLLKIMAALIAPSRGIVKILGGDPVRERIAIRRRLRFLGHEKQLYESLTVTENLNLVAGLRNLGGGRRRADVKEALERLGIFSFKDQRVEELSEGMKKRVTLARLLVGDADLILLDEPFPTLDRDGKEIMSDLIAGWRRTGKTILHASHDHDQALIHADRLLVLGNGSLSYDGGPK